MTLVFSQAAPFTGAAYEYLRADDALPSYRDIADEQDPLCQVKLFQPGWRFTYYVCAATEYDGIDGPVLTGSCVSPVGPDCDKFGDQGLAAIARVCLDGLPPERDLSGHGQLRTVGIVMYDMTIKRPEDWGELHNRGLGVIVDPFVFRLGQFFLNGKEASADETRWKAIASDLGALVTFFDLIVLNNHLPAFNYRDTFDAQLEFGDGLGRVLNVDGDKTVLNVDVDLPVYWAAKEAALKQLSARMGQGAFVPQATAAEILASIEAVEYDWEPGLGNLKRQIEDPGEVRLARFMVGQLVFAGYAQQSGAPHVLAPRRSLMMAAAGLSAELAGGDAETSVYRELARRCKDAGTGWRDDELPWTPSFLPFLLDGMDPYKEGPDVLLRRAKDLRESKAVRHYRDLRMALMSEDAARSKKARQDLTKAANKVAAELASDREDLEVSRHVVVEVLPKALGAATGAAGGLVVAGPPGAVGGAVVGAVGEDVLAQVNDRLWGWVVDRLPFRSARKLLARSVRAEYQLRDQLGPRLKTVWETGRGNA
jgi:hypothetical protein